MRLEPLWAVYRFRCPVCERRWTYADHGRRDPDTLAPKRHGCGPVEFVEKVELVEKAA